MSSDTSDSTLLGAAAEHYVMCQLLRRQMIAALAPPGVPDADIIVSDRVGSVLKALQVKARRKIGRDGGWHMKAKHEKMIRPSLLYCFIDFGDTINDASKCWVIPSAVVADVLRGSYKTWLAKRGKRGQLHKENDMRRLRPDYDDLNLDNYRPGWLNAYYQAWHLIADNQFS